MPRLLVRCAGCVLLATLAACRTAEFEDDLRISAQPKLLNDDGARARVVVSAADRYGDPGTGRVHVQSTAGSLRDGLDVVLRADGSIETELVCSAKLDSDCHDDVTVWVEWTSQWGVMLRRETKLRIRTTDAFVSACAFANRRALKYLAGNPPGLQLAVLDTQPEVASGAHSLSVWDPSQGVGALVLSLPPYPGTPQDENAALLAALGPLGAVSNPLEQTFTTWDDYPAVRTTFDLGSSGDLKAALDAAALALGGSSSGLQGSAGKAGPFKAELVAVRHGSAETAVVLALTEAASFDEAARFDLEDVAGGSALAQAIDGPAEHCEIFTVAGSKKVDFLWVVDDSCSMGSSQNAVATVGTVAASRIGAAQLDFQVGGVSTGFYPPAFGGSARPFTASLASMLAWFRFGSTTSWGTWGTGNEQGFAALANVLDGGVPGSFRADSEVHVIFLSDTKDHSGLTPQAMKAMLTARFPKQHVVVSGIVCPEGRSCGDDPEDAVGKYHTLIRQTGGVLGSITVFNPTQVTPALQAQQTDTINRIASTIINGAGYPLQYKPITASVRVAASAVADSRCDNRDIPRSTTDGWDLDPASGKLAFYGRCVPVLGGTMVVSYKSWVRGGTLLHETTTPVFAVPAPGTDGGLDGGAPDGGTPDGG